VIKNKGSSRIAKRAVVIPPFMSSRSAFAML